ncbi:MAG: adenylate/guanylate cyclase domain-containing protein [Gammaproteobacteria bacterium]|nr:adenylate/guanylate cyclase domain-containing protein [Gammaproteobacteria bacterium]
MSSKRQNSAEKQWQRLLAALAITAVAALLVWLIGLSGLSEPLERQLLDLQFQLHQDRQRHDPRIIIAAVDQRSIDHFDADSIPFPWPRSLYNPLIEYLTTAGAKAILFDILFNNQTPFGPEVDAEMASALASSGRTYLAAAFARGAAEEALAVDASVGIPWQGEAPKWLLRGDASLPLAPLLKGTAGIGSVSHQPDPDGIFRRMMPVIIWQQRLLAALALAPLLPQLQLQQGALRFADQRLPLQEDGYLQLNFRGGSEQFPRVAVLDIILDKLGRTPAVLDPALFRDSYVIVAYTAPGLFDLKPTPVSEQTPGAILHAQLLANTLDSDFMRPVPLMWQWGGVLLWSLLLTLLLLQQRQLPLLLLTQFGGYALFLLVTQQSFVHGYHWQLFTLLTFMLLASGMAGGYRYAREGRQKRYLQRAFSHYLSPTVVEQILLHPERLELGGEKREITILFSDLQGFTSLTEKLEAQQLVQALNGYTTVMADTINRYHGTVDKFIGDAVMAFWGAPLAQADQTTLAVTAALECMQRFEQFAKERYPAEVMFVRIGIDRGLCTVGNMGSDSRFDYTAIGDSVNQASRLEGLNKQYHTQILLSEAAWQPVAEQFAGRCIDYLRVKGKQQATRVYEVLAPLSEADALTAQRCRFYEVAFTAYQQQLWDEAKSALVELQQLCAAAGVVDGAALALQARIADYRDHPPPSDWDGSFTHHSK